MSAPGGDVCSWGVSALAVSALAVSDLGRCLLQGGLFLNFKKNFFIFLFYNRDPPADGGRYASYWNAFLLAINEC